MTTEELQTIVAQTIANNPDADYKTLCDIVYAEAGYMPQPADVRLAVKQTMNGNDE